MKILNKSPQCAKLTSKQKRSIQLGFPYSGLQESHHVEPIKIMKAKSSTLRNLQPQCLSNSGVKSTISARMTGSSEFLASCGDLSNLCKEERRKEAFQEIPLSRDIIYDLLQGCTKNKDLATGRRVHLLMVSSGLDSIAILEDQLLRMFASCGSLTDATQVFYLVSRPSVYTWNAIISAHTELGRGQRALEWYHSMQQNGVKPVVVTFLYILKACTNMGAIEQGRLIHDQIITDGFKLDLVIGNTLVDMYAKCGSLQEAHRVFDELPNRDVVSWGAMITGYVQHGHGLIALELFQKMHLEDVKPTNVTFLSALKACVNVGSIEQGRLLHEEIMRSGLESSLQIGSTIVDMYAKCGSLEEACKVFYELPYRDLVSWGALIGGFTQHGHGVLALDMFEKILKDGFQPDKVTFLCIVKACVSMGALDYGRLIHDQIIKSGQQLAAVLGNVLVDMYAKCGSLDDAHAIFSKILYPDEASWGVMIAGYLQHGFDLLALQLFESMQQRGIMPDKVIFLCVLKACSSIGLVRQGKLIHQQICEAGLHSDVDLGNALVNLYAKGQSLVTAKKVFDDLPNRNMETWDAMIAGYSHNNCGASALELYWKMQVEGLKPVKSILLCTLKTCGSLGGIEQGRLLHYQIVESDLDSDGIIGNTLVDMYTKCGSLDEAYKVFRGLPNRDLVSWGAMIAGYAAHGQGHHALEFFEKMELEGITPNAIIFSCILKACSSVGILHGRLIHHQIIRSGATSDVIGNTLVDMYAKCGSAKDAQKVFDDLPNRDVVSWGAMIAGYTLSGSSVTALKLFKKMQQQGIKPNMIIFLSILKACCSLGAIEEGRLIHKKIIESGFGSDVLLGNTLMHMYTKCGSLQEARNVFNDLQNRDMVSWGVLMTAYVHYGNCRLVEQCFLDMQQQGLKPSDLIFTSILSACSHAGLLIEGCQYFRSMMVDYGYTPSLKHYSCMVDLLGRAGCLCEAKDLLQTMPIPPDIVILTSLLSSCRTYGNKELGRHCFDELLNTDPSDASWYVLMSNIYADVDMWEDAEKLEELRKCVGAQRKPGRAWIELDSNSHEFVVGSKRSSPSDDMYTKLSRLSKIMKHDAHVPQLDVVLNVTLEEEEDALFR